MLDACSQCRWGAASQVGNIEIVHSILGKATIMNYMSDDISALGLHQASSGWALGLISEMPVRTVREGSTIAMKAIKVNSAAMMRKAVAMNQTCR